jgi:RimJ/RimL family protein N-acetyltransferase
MNYHAMFESRDLRLTTIDLEKDPAVVAHWSEDLRLARRLRNEQPLRPLTDSEARKALDEWVKEVERANRCYFYALRPTGDERLVGYLRISEVLWVHGAATFELVIGSPEDWAAYAAEGLRLGLHYAFDELNLFRVAARVDEHDELSRELYTVAQFYLEVRQRQAVYYQGRYWDSLLYGMLRPEWFMAHQQMGVAL